MSAVDGNTIRRLALAILVVVAVSVNISAQDSPSGLRVVSSSSTIQLSQYGITWTFSAPVEYGTYVTGDYWVVGPVELVDITPNSREVDGRVVNGSMLNPDPSGGSVHGFDSASRNTRYADNLNVARPGGRPLSSDNTLRIEAGASLVSSVSHPEPENRPQITDAAILTVVSVPPAEDAFRPPYAGTNKGSNYHYSELRTELLQTLPRVRSTPSIGAVAEAFQRPWLDFIPDWPQRDVHPSNNMPLYGRDIASQVGVGALMLHLNFSLAEKRELLIGFLQLGVDLWGIVNNGGENNWVPNGGHASGRKWPILFAGLMLDDSDMQALGSGDGSGVAYFGEDAQTFKVSQEDIELTHNPDDRSPAQEYDASHFGMPEWGIRHATEPVKDNADWRATYRSCCTAVGWSGFVLAARIMGATTIWSHDPLFEYQDRYMKVSSGQDDGWDVNGEPNDVPYFRTWTDFAAQMWDTYR